jgi:prophage antirepressor-like protein
MNVLIIVRNERNINMDKQLQIFEKSDFGKIRSIEIDGKAYFVGSDIAKALGYQNTSKAISDHCKGVTKRYIPTNGGQQEMNVMLGHTESPTQII